MGDEVGFLRADKHECFLQVHGVTLVARHAQSTQSKYTTSL